MAGRLAGAAGAPAAPAAPRTGVPDPAGSHLVVLARDPEGYARLARAHQRGPARRRRERPSPSRPRPPGRARRRPLPRPDGLSQGSRACCARRSRSGCGRERARPPRRARSAARTSSSSCSTTATRSTRPATTPWPLSRSRRDSASSRRTSSTTPCPPAAASPPCSPRSDPAVLSTSSTAGCQPQGPAYLRSGAEQARRFARYPGAVELAAELGRACAFDLRLVAPELPDFPVPAGPQRDELSSVSSSRRGRPGATGPGAERVPGAWRQLEHELADDRGAGFRRLLPRRLGHRRVLPALGDLLPGSRVGRQLGRLLRARDHQRRRRRRSACCSSASCPPSGTARRTSTSTSSPGGARR